jgi:DNA-binding XRE family transcriptional regulator
LKVTDDCITNWENERCEPQIKYIPAIISFLGYNPFLYNLETIGGRIKYYRQIKGLNLSKMGILIDVDPSTLGSWEKNENIPSKKSQRKLNTLLSSY